MTIQREYEYLAVLDIGSNKISTNSDLLGGTSFGKKGGPSALVTEAIEFIELQFMKNPKYTENQDEKRRLFAIENIENTDQIKIIVRAESLESAKRFSQIIIQEVHNKFKEKISGLLKLNNERVAKLEAYTESITEQINQINITQEKIGLSPVLLERRAQLADMLLKVESDKSIISGLLKSGNIRPMKIILSRPTSYKHVSPKYTLVLLLSFTVFTIGCLGHALLSILNNDNKIKPETNRLDNSIRKIS
ncbi:MAG: hypothetical protein KA116_05310 [Proteobacteria bacterium]|nr:hypothetical protein [Pseudomonadota bacterium]